MRKFLLITSAVSGLAASAAESPRYLPTRQVVLEYGVQNTAEITRAELWVSRDGQRTWQAVEAAATRERTVRFLAPEDGRYDFCLVLHSPGGASAEPPRPGCAPTTSVIVDTRRPLLQVHAVHSEPGDDGSELFGIDATLVEENLSPSGLRVFYRPRDGEWIDGGSARWDEGEIRWTPAVATPQSVDLRVIATDLAGNRSACDVADIRLPAAGARPVPASQPAAQVSEALPAARQPLNADVARLRGRAADAMRAGQYSEAVARLEEALRLSPDDADVLAEAGQALHRMGRLEDANGRLEAALQRSPDHVAALEHSALAAVTQKRYPLARERLHRLQALLPQSGLVWLRSGDVEQRLGDTRHAVEAWERVLNGTDADAELREKAQRRLNYFGKDRGRGDSSPARGAVWPDPPAGPPSSSSSATSSTKRPPR